MAWFHAEIKHDVGGHLFHARTRTEHLLRCAPFLFSSSFCQSFRPLGLASNHWSIFLPSRGACADIGDDDGEECKSASVERRTRRRWRRFG